MRKLILSCKKATYLISLKEEGKLSVTQKIQLATHITVCSMCRLFEKQTHFISKNAKNLGEHSNEILSGDAKANMNKLINEIISGK